MKSSSLHSAVLGALLAGVGAGEASAEDWQFRASLYGYFPAIGGTTRFATPVSDIDIDIDIDADNLIENTEFAAMGSFEAQRGRLGVFTDVIYMDVGDGINESTSLGRGTVPLPAGVTADASLDVQASAWTLGASLRAVSTSRTTLDVFAGARLLDAEGSLSVALNIGPRFSAAAERDAWDGIVGVKGQVNVGARGQWFIPYYLDVGAGDSDLTSQVATGIGYTAGRAQVFAAWRYLDYDFGSDASIRDLDFSGPALGIAFNF
jgi:hypothetical protein